MPDNTAHDSRNEYSIDEVFRPFLNTLRKAEYISPRKLEAYQRRALGELLVHARAAIPFYGERLAPLFAGDGSIDWSRWREVPVLTRDEVQSQGEALFAHDLAAHHGDNVAGASSGSTGKPVRSITSNLAQVAATCLEYLHHDWHGLDRSKRLAVIRYIAGGGYTYPEGGRVDGWSEMSRHFGDGGDCVFLDLTTPVHQQIEWLNRMKPDYIGTGPSNLAEMIELVNAGDELEFTPKATLTYAGQLGANLRERVSAVLGVSVFDIYSATETGIIALQCNRQTHYHAAAPTILVEILREDNTLCQAGETGRVIVTPFYNHAMPLIRYDIGDYAEPGLPCRCGRSWPVLAKIHGRSRNMFRFPDGSTVWPIIHSDKMRRHMNFRQYQVVQVAPLEIEIRFVPAGDDGGVFDLEGLTNLTRKALGQPVNVKVTPMKEILRSAGGKFEDYVCELPASPAKP